jgi:hypothetical protein
MYENFHTSKHVQLLSDFENYYNIEQFIKVANSFHIMFLLLFWK